ncbi:Site-specific recombinase XerD [Micromonospora echinaurantiaca]|uniref:Site-specific recombinase XerD n=1 Tax=Micromonospora echinaurantiaca TaxID=47857 RepID=A0A1C5K027_9ACTN|nr:tyrosine-type recombinase/integrase [Micromonospora echinaurantiaca]SCG76088.1 Site-specific recombinase XerD [Micromonospora echinaurantiaca]
MAHIVDRWYRTVVGPDGKSRQVPKPECGQGMRYRVRYIAPDGKEKSQSFPDKKKREAQAFLAQVQADILKGTYVDPDAGRTTFKQYADDWLAAATTDVLTRDRIEYELRLHVYPTFGDQPIASIQPATIRSWARKLQETGLAVSYRRVLFTDVSMIFNAAVDDRKIVSNPFAVKSIRRPKLAPTKVVPWSVARLAAFREKVRSRYRIAVDLGAGCGLRQGEIFAVSPGDLDSTRPVLHVTRQIKLVRGQLIFAPPKGGKSRQVPLPGSVAGRLKRHVQDCPPVAVTLPWGTLTGELRTVELYLTTPAGTALSRSMFNSGVWKPAIRATGIPDDRHNGMHVLRHTYASVLLDAGESIKALSAYLGHADPGFTLRTYTHLLPTSEDRTRRAIDKALGEVQAADDEPGVVDGLETA